MDYWTEDPSRLNGQPKKTIGDYVASHGIPAAERLESFEHAKEVDGFARSEHEVEYVRDHFGTRVTGVSGLLSSRRVEGLHSEEEMKAQLTSRSRDPEKIDVNIERFCRWTKQDVSTFLEQTSYSYWEHVDGINCKVVADSAVPNRYHIGQISRKVGESYFVTLENGEVIISNAEDPDISRYSGLIEMYEAVRALPHMEPGFIGVMEAELLEDRDVWLQYHRTRQFEESEPFLRGAAPKNMYKAVHVRGATPPEGIEIEVIHAYGWWFNDKVQNPSLPKSEEGSMDKTYDVVFKELMCPTRKAFVTEAVQPELEIAKLVDHTGTSQFHKPDVSLIVPEAAIPLPTEEQFDHSSETGEDITYRAHIISDGRDAYFRII